MPEIISSLLEPPAAPKNHKIRNIVIAAVLSAGVIGFVVHMVAHALGT